MTPGELAELRVLLTDDTELVRAVASGRQRNASVPFRRVELRYVDLSSGRHLHITAYDDTQAHSRNSALGPAAERAVDELLAQPYANWHIETRSETVQMRVTKRGRALLHRAARADPTEPDRGHDRSKQRRLAEGDPVFRALGLATADGQIKPSRRAKFRQVQDFLGRLDPVLDDMLLDTLLLDNLLPANPVPPDPLFAGSNTDGSVRRPLRLVDLGCGNAYLTFAAFRYLSAVRQVPVQAVGVDAKPSARRHNQDVAERLGIAESFEFVDGAISAAVVPAAPDLVLALHACDTATDDALAVAVRWQAPVVLAAPCCHHDVQRQLSRKSPPAPYELVMRHPILRERFADVLTDALRAAVLRIVGYRTDVVEFVDAEHTPRNALICAVRTDAPPTRALLAAYESLVDQWQVRPALADRLAADHPVLRRRSTTSTALASPSG